MNLTEKQKEILGELIRAEMVRDKYLFIDELNEEDDDDNLMEIAKVLELPNFQKLQDLYNCKHPQRIF